MSIRLNPSLGIAVAAMAGMALPLQARINGELGLQMQDGLLAAIVSFAGAALIMGIATACLPSGRAALGAMFSHTRAGRIPWAFHTAGLIGAYFVFAQTTFVAVVGVAIYTVAAVTGQTVSGLAVDRIGLGPGGKRHITAVRVIGVVLTVLAVLWAVSPRISDTADPLSLLLPVGLLVLAGILMSFQHAMNGTVAAEIRSPLPGTLANYLVGSLALVIAWLVKSTVEGQFPMLPPSPWLYTGGALGCLNLVISALLIRHIGVLFTGLGMIVGQLVSSLLLDWLLPVAGSAIYPETVLGTLLTLAAVVIAALPWTGLRNRRSSG